MCSWAERNGGVSWHPHHIAERYALFVIILLGESVLAVSTGIADVLGSGLHVSLIVVACSGLMVAFWAIVLGIGEIGGAFASRRGNSTNWGWTLAAGVPNVVFGIVLLIWPASGILTLVWLVGFFTLVGGLALIVLAFRVRSVGHVRR